MRRLLSALAIAAGLTLLASPAHAQPYPPTTSGLTVSQSTVRAGESIVVTGEGAEPGATVVITMSRVSALGLRAGARAVAAGPSMARMLAAVRPLAQGAVVLGRTTAADDGSFRATVTIPIDTAPGIYTLSATSGGEVLGVVTLRVLAAAGAEDDDAGALPFTGSDVAPGLAVGVGLILAGGLMLLAVRRRRRATA
jgi:5'-nucleotidase